MANPNLDDNILNQPIAIADAANMLRHQIKKNEKVFDATLMKLNNQLVDRWYEEVLVKIASKGGQIACGRVWPSWLVFLEGVHMEEYIKNIDKRPQISESQVKWWLDFFLHANLEELHARGAAFVGEGWNLVTMAIRHHFAKEKWEKIYSKSKDPKEWDQLANENIGITQGRPLPFGIDPDEWKEMTERIETFFKVQVKPR